jgi:transposase
LGLTKPLSRSDEYVTVILDRKNDVVFDVLDDRNAKTVELWLRKRPGRYMSSLKTLTIDTWDLFILAVRNCIPEAQPKVCSDCFRMAQYFGKALDTVRAQKNLGLLGAGGSSPLTGTRYEWQKTKLDNRSRREFMALSHLNLKTARAWRIKKTAARLWNHNYCGSAEKALNNLLGWISRCSSEPVKKVRRMLRRFPWGALNANAYPVSNVVLEAKNASIQKSR